MAPSFFLLFMPILLQDDTDSKLSDISLEKYGVQNVVDRFVFLKHVNTHTHKYARCIQV
jgi:hypothetical protein